MATPFSKYVMIDALGIAAMNAVLNAGYTGWVWHSHDRLTLTGDGGIAFDLAGTPVWIAVLSTLLGTAAVRRKLWEGLVAQPATPVPMLLALLPRSIVLRAAIFGAASVAFLAIPLWAMLQLSRIGAVSMLTGVLLKVAITVAMTFVIVPIVILAGVGDLQPPRGRRLLEESRA